MAPHLPEWSEFSRMAVGSTVVPVFRRLVADELTPVGALSRLGRGEGSFLLESVIGGEQVGRYSFVGAKPFLTVEAKNGEWIERRGAEERRSATTDPFADLARLFDDYRMPVVPGLPRFAGGAVGFVAYDAVRYVENLPNGPVDDRNLPDLYFSFYDEMVVFDHINKVVNVIALARIPKGASATDLADAFHIAAAKTDGLVDRLSQPSESLAAFDIPADRHVSLPTKSNMTREAYMAAVEKCKEYIRAGDFFQIVVSQRLETQTDADAFDIYRTLRVVNPSPFMVYLRTPATTLVASSPEIMVRVWNREIVVRPLAGTRPRGQNADEDRLLAEELLRDPKEIAEHVMLVDLGRNDVGRVADFGSVELSDLMVVERYSHVMHITSNVTGKLRPELHPLDALKACLPAGTVSGAPKVRAMELIDELEPQRRGPYAGAIGYLDFTGNMDTCIALRTMVMTGKTAYVQAGAGIVYDSDPATEYEETLNKARGLLKAIEIAQARTNAARSE